MHTSYTAVVIALAVSGRSVAAQNSGYSVTSIADAPFIISGADSSENNFIVTTTADAATCQSMCTGGPITQSDGSSKPCVVAVYTPSSSCYNFPALAGVAAEGANIPAGTTFFLRYDVPATLSGDTSAICSPEKGDVGILSKDDEAGDNTEYLTCQCGPNRMNYAGQDGNSYIACVDDPSAAVQTSSTSSLSSSTAALSSSTSASMSSSSTTTSSSSTSSSAPSASSSITLSSTASAPLFSSTSMTSSTQAPMTTSSSSSQASSTAAAQAQPQASMKRRRRVRRSLLRFN